MHSIYGSLLALLLVATTTGTPTGLAAPVANLSDTHTLKTGIPLIRVFRGFRRQDIKPEVFIADLQTRFIPAVARTHAKNGLVAYLPALPPAVHPPTLPDEMAMVHYESAEVYQKAKATPEGQAYSELHWEIFDKQRSLSTSAISLESTQNQLQADVGYDLMQLPTNWQLGHSTFYIGWRKPTVAAADFLPRLTRHVKDVRSAFGPLGLQGYVVIATSDYEIAFMNWQDRAAADKAFASAAAQKVVSEAQSLLEMLQWSTVSEFAGQIQPGQAVNVRFQRRK